LDGPTIRRLGPGDIEELRRFLVEGYKLDPQSIVVSPDVLRWKYLDESGGTTGDPRSLIACHEGRIVGHIGRCPGKFVTDRSGGAVSTVHFIDWLASPSFPSVGLRLIQEGFEYSETQYALDASEYGKKMIKAIGYESRASVGYYLKVIRPFHRLRAREHGWVGRGLRVVKDIGQALGHPAWPPRLRVDVRPVEQFGPEIDDLVRNRRYDVVFNDRSCEVLNGYLSFPDHRITGWTLHLGERLVGFALLRVYPRGAAQGGKIVECFLDSQDDALWHAAVAALSRKLHELSADLVLCLASTPWMAHALERSGYMRLGAVEFFLRDSKNLIPTALPYHLTFLEGDEAYHVH
jgi:hypothetical protein